MATRKPLSQRQRFEVFKRDGFRCAYCGATPIQSALHVDHVVPVADGGGNAADNLVTSCAECNLGKSSVPLDSLAYEQPDPEKAKQARDHVKQIQAFLAAQREIVAAKDAAFNELAALWCARVGCTEYSANLRSILPRAIQDFGIDRVVGFMEIVGRHRSGWEHKQDAFVIDCKYFCGILRRRREED